MPSVAEFEKRLQKHDRHLGLEWLGDHYTVIDKSRPVSYRTIDLGGATKRVPTFQRVLHLKPGQSLDGGVINEVKSRDMRRWARDKDFKDHLQNQLDEAEARPEKEKEEALHALAHEGWDYVRGVPKVTVNGNKDGILYDASGKAI